MPGGKSGKSACAVSSAGQARTKDPTQATKESSDPESERPHSRAHRAPLLRELGEQALLLRLRAGELRQDLLPPRGLLGEAQALLPVGGPLLRRDDPDLRAALASLPRTSAARANARPAQPLHARNVSVGGGARLSFTYDAASGVGPARWGAAVDPDCGGDAQSPVDLDPAARADAETAPPLADALSLEAGECAEYTGETTASTLKVGEDCFVRRVAIGSRVFQTRGC